MSGARKSPPQKANGRGNSPAAPFLLHPSRTPGASVDHWIRCGATVLPELVGVTVFVRMLVIAVVMSLELVA